ncbi:hypothetical protein GTA07_19475 [Rhodococcus hoagii]|nr:hypothetical protein [Prescottella equi]
MFGFARYSPNQNATTNEIYPNHPELQSVSTQAGADEFKSQYADWGLGSGTNWDHALYRVATSGVHYDATIVLTDGNPTRWGLQGPPVTPSGDGSNTHFADVEEAIFSANLLKKNETRVVSFVSVEASAASRASIWPRYPDRRRTTAPTSSTPTTSRSRTSRVRAKR